MKSKNIKAENALIIDLEDERLIPDLFGEYDGNLVRIEKTLGVNIRGRGKIIEVSGEKSEFAESVIKDLYLQLTKGYRVGIEEVDASIIMNRSNDKIIRDSKAIDFIIKTTKKNIRPRLIRKLNMRRHLNLKSFVLVLGQQERVKLIWQLHMVFIYLRKGK